MSTSNSDPQLMIALHVDVYDSADTPLGRHAHNANEFILVLKGRGIHRTSVGEVPFRAGDIHFFARAQLHEHLTSDRESTILLMVRLRDGAFITESFIDRDIRKRLDFLRRRSYLKGPRISLNSSGHRVLKELLLRSRDEHRGRQPGFKAMLHSLAIQIILTVTRDPNTGFLSSKAVEPGILNVLTWLESNHNKRVSVSQMARLAFMSRSHFHAQFRSTAGTTLLDHVKRLRVASAIRLLTRTRLPLAEVCRRAGFSSVSRFYESFKEIHGTTPGTFRRRNLTIPA